MSFVDAFVDKCMFTMRCSARKCKDVCCCKIPISGLFWFLRQVKRGLQAGFDAAKRYFVDGFVDDFCVVLEA